MKHFVRGFEPQPLSGPVIQSVLNHSQLFLAHCAQRSLFGHILAQQAVEVLVAAPLPAAVGVGKVCLLAQSLVNLLMLREFFSVVLGQCFGQAQIGLEPLLYRLGHQVGPFERHLG